MHTHSNERAYLISESRYFFYTTNGGQHWHKQNTPSLPNRFGAAVLRFQPRSDSLIWIGEVGCDGNGESCHAQAQYSRDNGRNWQFIEDYVLNCDWARDKELLVDPNQILCESYQNKQGSQRLFGPDNALQLISGRDYYSKKTKLFEHVVGFTKFSEYLIVAQVSVTSLLRVFVCDVFTFGQYLPARNALDLQVSLDGLTFATGKFPPGMHPDTHVCPVVFTGVHSVVDDVCRRTLFWNQAPTPSSYT